MRTNRRADPLVRSRPPGRLFPYTEGMEVHFAPETEEKLKDLAAQSGRGTADQLVQDVVEGYFDELCANARNGRTAAMTT